MARSESVLHQLMKSKKIVRAATKHIGGLLWKENEVLCSDAHNSLLLEQTQASMELFTWESLWSEFHEVAPLAVLLLQSSFKAQVSSTPKSQRVICTVLTLLCKATNQKMSLLQGMVFLILYAGHAGKQVTSHMSDNINLYIHLK